MLTGVLNVVTFFAVMCSEVKNID